MFDTKARRPDYYTLELVLFSILGVSRAKQPGSLLVDFLYWILDLPRHFQLRQRSVKPASISACGRHVRLV